MVRLVPAGRPLLAGWVGMAGLVFVLHFGTFRLLSCAWRAAGVDAKRPSPPPAVAAEIVPQVADRERRG